MQQYRLQAQHPVTHGFQDDLITIFFPLPPATKKQDGRVCTIIERGEIDVEALMHEKISKRFNSFKPRQKREME